MFGLLFAVTGVVVGLASAALATDDGIERGTGRQRPADTIYTSGKGGSVSLSSRQDATTVSMRQHVVGDEASATASLAGDTTDETLLAPEEETEVVPYGSLPPSARRTVEQKLGGPGDYRCSRFTESDSTLYQISAIRDGLSVELIVTGEGEMVFLSREIPFSRLPAAVQEKLRAANADGKFTSIQEVTARAYSATYRDDNGEEVELRVEPSGVIQEE